MVHHGLLVPFRSFVQLGFACVFSKEVWIHCVEFTGLDFVLAEILAHGT